MIEAKAYGEKLEEVHADQLKRYFPFVKTAQIGILTNGHIYKFYTDLEQENVMDSSPYMEFDIEKFSPELISKLQELHKDRFDGEKAIIIAEELKYTRQFKALLNKQLEQPEEEFVKFFARKVWSAIINQNVKDKLTPLLKTAFKQFIEDKITERLIKAAGASEVDVETTNVEEKVAEQVVEEVPAEAAETTESERLGFTIVQAIAAGITDPNRIAMRDRKSYSAILLDDNANKTILRLHFNSEKSLKLRLIGNNPDDKPFPIDQVSDIYKYSARILEIIKEYDEGKKVGKKVKDKEAE